MTHLNTIMITGTAKNVRKNTGKGTTVLLVEYKVYIWGCKKDDALQFVGSLNKTLNGYNELWQKAKDIAVEYFKEGYMQDGAYTQFLDHITIID